MGKIDKAKIKKYWDLSNSALNGVVAGIFPARKAANLNHIDSLRYEYE